MDISIIKSENTNTKTGIKIGNDSAPIKVVEFMNVRCPYCKRWFEDHDDLLNQYVAEGKVQRIIKPFNKEKASLRIGNVLHQYIPNEGEKAYAALVEIYATQGTWGHLSEKMAAEFAEDELHLTKVDNRQTMLDEIVDEANAANIQFVPTVIVEDQIFDESITTEELTTILSKIGG